MIFQSFESGAEYHKILYWESLSIPNYLKKIGLCVVPENPISDIQFILLPSSTCILVSVYIAYYSTTPELVCICIILCYFFGYPPRDIRK